MKPLGHRAGSSFLFQALALAEGLEYGPGLHPYCWLALLSFPLPSSRRKPYYTQGYLMQDPTILSAFCHSPFFPREGVCLCALRYLGSSPMTDIQEILPQPLRISLASTVPAEIHLKSSQSRIRLRHLMYAAWAFGRLFRGGWSFPLTVNTSPLLLGLVLPRDS